MPATLPSRFSMASSAFSFLISSTTPPWRHPSLPQSRRRLRRRRRRRRLHRRIGSNAAGPVGARRQRSLQRIQSCMRFAVAPRRSSQIRGAGIRVARCGVILRGQRWASAPTPRRSWRQRQFVPMPALASAPRMRLQAAALVAQGVAMTVTSSGALRLIEPRKAFIHYPSIYWHRSLRSCSLLAPLCPPSAPLPCSSRRSISSSDRCCP
mmetsp:Transcript_20632/g.60894  ORF Transcript_20632/g.60894 Transcript_20632/m.60894 type:complete len:209 (-) Transcript_20632:765-1391(-)